MIRPPELATDEPYAGGPFAGREILAVLEAADRGDGPALSAALARRPGLHRVEYEYTPPLQLAVRSGSLEAVEVLLEAGADPAPPAPGEDLLVTARDRGWQTIAARLERARRACRRSEPAASTPVHEAAARNDLEALREALANDPTAIDRADEMGATPLHRAVAASAHDALDLLLRNGAAAAARHGAGRATPEGYPAVDFEPADLALWRDPFWNPRGDLEAVRRLIAAGATIDLVLAAALGDEEGIERLIAGGVDAPRPCGKRALSTAIEHGRLEIAERLLAAGADPNAPEGACAPRGAALYAAARAGDRAAVELLLAHGADPNAWIDSGGSATYVASTSAIRRLLIDAGGRLSVYDLIWLGEDDAALRLVEADPTTADVGCGGALAAACGLGRGELVARLLAAGARVPPVVSGCRAYLLEDPELLGMLLDSGMDPDLPSWQRATPLHDLCGRDARGRPRPRRRESAERLLAAGADLERRDHAYRSTPLGWAARCDLPDMIEWLLAHGARAESPAELPPELAWTAPIAWAERRGHRRCARLLG